MRVKISFKKDKDSPIKYPCIKGTVSDFMSDGIILRDCGKNNIIACKIYNNVDNKLSLLKVDDDKNETYTQEYVITDIEKI